jgi:hypothetical protein
MVGHKTESIYRRCALALEYGELSSCADARVMSRTQLDISSNLRDSPIERRWEQKTRLNSCPEP